MSYSKTILLRISLASGVLLFTAGSYAQVCDLEPVNGVCGPPVCSDIPEDQCLATVLHVDFATGAIVPVACECFNPIFCHIEFGNASPFAVGECPAGHRCEVVAFELTATEYMTSSQPVVTPSISAPAASI